MSESKDASKSDERQVKNTPKPLTQKRKGETYTMGNRGMTNWKLGAFFIISLMLCAGLFSNTAMAADGAGSVKVAWDNSGDGTLNSDQDDTNPPATPREADGVTDDDSEAADTTPLNAGSRWNVLKITYTATDADKMAGGLVRIRLPGWAMGTIAEDAAATTNVNEKGHYKNVSIVATPYNNADPQALVTAEAETLYNTNATADQQTIGVATPESDANKEVIADLLDMVSLSTTMVEVMIPRDWMYGGQIVITLGDVTTGIPTRLPNGTGATAYAEYQLTASSKARNGTLVSLASANQANVRVGNILGTRTDTDAKLNITRDTTVRKVTIDPTVVYHDEMDRDFTITFTAPGPMYDGRLDIDIPAGIQPDGSSTVSVSSSGPGVGSLYFNNVATTTTVAADTAVANINVPLTSVNQGQTVTVRYTVDVGDAATAVITGAFGLQTDVAGTTDSDVTDPGVFMISARSGSGDVTLTPTFAAVGTPKTFRVKYTALTDLTDVQLQITPMGIVIVDDTATTTITEELTTTSGSYGYVRASSVDARKGELSVSGTTIEWDNLNLKKGESVTTTIGPVNVMSRAGMSTWYVFLANDGTVDTTTPDDPAGTRNLEQILDVDSMTKDNQTLDFYATQAVPNGVAFAIKSPMDYPAGSKQIIEFQFTANATPIRDGYVRVQLPGTWTAPNPALKGTTPADTKLTTDVSGKASVKVGGGVSEDRALTISGNTITAHIDSLEQADTVTITYGKAEADNKITEAVIQRMAQSGVKIYGYSKASPDTSEIRQEISVNVVNAADGSGSATIVASPGGDTLQAGSSNSQVHVEFTAAGTMKDGHVQLELPAGWGAFQRDPVEPNYIEIRGSGASLVEPAIGSTSTRAVAKINDRLGPTGSFTFVYGGGTGGDQNGVDAQDHLGPATFIIKSDGNGDMVYASVMSETKYDGDAATEVQLRTENPHRLGRLFAGYDGELRLLVGGAAGGSGSAVVDITAVNAANPVTLKFTYTATQTIQNGNLKLTVPSGWSMPQTDDPSQPGYTEATGTGLGAAADDNAQSVTVPITFINSGDTITITYGQGAGQAVATMVGKNHDIHDSD